MQDRICGIFGILGIGNWGFSDGGGNAQKDDLGISHKATKGTK